MRGRVMEDANDFRSSSKLCFHEVEMTPKCGQHGQLGLRRCMPHLKWNENLNCVE